MTEEAVALGLRREYLTPAQRSEDRRRQAAANRAAMQAEEAHGASGGGPDGAPLQRQARLNVWRVTDGQRTVFVRCPSRSGAKIFLAEQHGWTGVTMTSEIVDSVPEGAEVLTASFRTVREVADEYESSKRK